MGRFLFMLMGVALLFPYPGTAAGAETTAMGAPKGKALDQALSDLRTLSSEIRSSEKDIEDAQNLILSGKTMTLQEHQSLLDRIEMDRSQIAAYWPDLTNNLSFLQANWDLLTEEQKAFVDQVRQNLH